MVIRMSQSPGEGVVRNTAPHVRICRQRDVEETRYVKSAGRNDGQLRRVAAADRPRIAFTFDGAPLEALAGDTVLTAILTNRRYLRRLEFGGAPRAGFCLIGACQDCWVGRADAPPLRACTTLLEPGMHLTTEARDGA